ncbi:MAG TPA: hypothetical protein VFR34_01775 [Paracoccaceae bacterium]|nr:hypothetical protein [Paracoccaceae bacterium]
MIMGLLVATLGTTAAAAQGQVCGERTAIVQRLQDKYGETRQSMGLQQNNGVVEIFASDESGTWTILVTMPNGTTCLVAAGEAWDGNATFAAAPGKDM